MAATRVAVLSVFTVALLAGCGALPSNPSGTSDPEPTPSATTPPTSFPGTTTSYASTTLAPPAEFPPGVYYSRPSSFLNQLVHLDDALARQYALRPNGYSISPQAVVYSEQQAIVLLRPDGLTERIGTGLFHVARPALSPDGTQVAVQATATSAALANEPGSDFDIYVIDLASGASKRVSHLGINDESPEWIPGTSLLAYSSFDPQTGIDLHIYDVAADREVAVFARIGGLHLDASEDGAHILECKGLRIYGRTSGILEQDLKQAAVAGMQAAGYALDTTHDGVEHQGSFPLDCAFSPDGTKVVFDGAVTGKGEGLLVMRIGLDGSSFEVLAGPVAADPARSNGHNYSQLNPDWI